MTLSNKKIYHLSVFLGLIALSLLYYHAFITAGNSFLGTVRGKILLQVEDKGEAWYVDPNTDERMYLKKPRDAFYTMKTLGTGITKENLSRIPIAEANLEGKDTDGDGLSEAIENALGTDPEKKDTDGDGYTDKEEILNNYNPLGEGKMPIDEAYAREHGGRIFLQSDQHGEGWYLNPADNKRYFLGSPTDAFRVMRSTGLGISNENLARIPEYKLPTEEENDTESENQNQNNNPGEYDSNLKRYSQDKFSFRYNPLWKILRSQPENNLVMLGNYNRDPFLEHKGVITAIYIKTDQSQTAETFAMESRPYYRKIKEENKTINNRATIKEIFKYSELDNNYETNYIMQIDEDEFFNLRVMGPTENAYSGIAQTILETLEVK